MRTLRVKNKKVQQELFGKWMDLQCENKDCLKPATIIMRNNEAVLCLKHYNENNKIWDIKSTHS